ncbi:hypothetical protein HPB47_020653 [Ixodes persulcatus]|uniref:Uncharacterized protein n=1 Tax=Ixodes persulcatus TaxID=34615 RepID=A0AC60QER9_IXOPE|nr:hypothetical protein HPB47_020653 [Ixodes persulcatus]
MSDRLPDGTYTDANPYGVKELIQVGGQNPNTATKRVLAYLPTDKLGPNLCGRDLIQAFQLEGVPIYKMNTDPERPSAVSIAEAVREEVHRALLAEVPVAVAPEQPVLTYAAASKRNPPVTGHYQPAPRREAPAPQYAPRPEQRGARKTDVWRTADRRPLCYHCGEADHIYRRCPYRQLGLRGFAPNDPRPRLGERPRDIEDYLRRSSSPESSPRREPALDCKDPACSQSSSTPSAAELVDMDSESSTGEWNLVTRKRTKRTCSWSSTETVRYNDRLNLIAVEVLNEQAAQALLKTTDLCRVPVRPYLALSGPTTVGVIRDVDMDTTEEQLEHNLRSENRIADIRRLGKSRERPLQCHNCGGFGHKKVSCMRAMACKRCGEQHEATDAMCQSPTLRCVNCKGDHEATSHACPKWIKERKILTYSKTNSIGFRAARSALEGQKASRSGEEDAQPEILSQHAKQLSKSRAVIYAPVAGGTHSLPPNTEEAHGSAGNGALAAATSEPPNQTSKQLPQTRQRSSTQEGDAEDKSASSGEAPGWTGLTYEQPDGRHNEGRFTPTPHGTGLATTESTLNSGDTPRHFSGGNGDRTAHRLVVQVEAGALGRSLKPSPARRLEERALRNIARMSSLPPADTIRKHLFARPNSHLGRQARRFDFEVGAPSEFILPQPPHSTRPPLEIHATFPIPQRKANVPGFVARSIALERIDEVVASEAAAVEDMGWCLALQWIPSLVGIPGNERVDQLAAKAHDDPVPTFLLDRFNEAHRFIREILTERHPHPGVAAGRPPPVVPRKLPKAETSLLHRLRAGCPYTAMRLHMMRRKADPNCPTCGDPEDTEHALLVCSTHQEARRTLFHHYTLSGLPYGTITELLNPRGTRGTAEKAFRALLRFLRDTGLANRL